MIARVVNVHASCVRLGRAGLAFAAPEDAGILIFGRSGAGKSDLALRMVAAGSVLVSDDRTELFLRGGRLHARPPARIAGMIEVRGAGIVQIPYAEDVRVALVVALAPRVVRLPKPARYSPPASLKLPRLSAPPLLGIAGHEAGAPARIAAAAAAFARGGWVENVKPE